MKQDKKYMALVALTVALGGFVWGFDATVISGAVPFIQKYFGLNGDRGDFLLGLAVSCLGRGVLGGTAVAGFWNSAVSASVTFIFPWELSHLGTAGTFPGYGLMAAAAVIFVLLFIPETKGRTLEELEGILLRKG
jgi:hypothetical protein